MKNNEIKRVFLCVLDSVGAGELPDAATFGDAGSHTLKSVFETGKLCIPNLQKLGIGNIDGLDFLGKNDVGTGDQRTPVFGKSGKHHRSRHVADALAGEHRH